MNNVRMWKGLFSKKHLSEHFQEKISPNNSVGLDKITVSKFNQNLNEELEIIERKVKGGTYKFTRFRQVLFLKGPNKEPRIISIPTVRDKLVTSVLNEFFLNIYGEECLSPLPQIVIANIQKEIPFYESFIKIDISKFYSSINHRKLLRIIGRKIRKKEIKSLIQKAISTETISLPIKEKKDIDKIKQGVPEGLPISNALANIYLSDIDKKYRDDSRVKYYRYVDDILILTDYENLTDIKETIYSDLKKLNLNVNKEKLASDSTTCPFSFLGYYLCKSFTSVKRSSIYKLEDSIDQLLKQGKNNNHKYIEWRLNLKITGFIINEHKYGWLFFYSQITDTSILHHLDWFTNKLLHRYGLYEELHVKKFVRAFYEITKKLHSTHYIPNMDNYSLEEKKQVLLEIYDEEVEDMSDTDIEYKFRKIMKREMQNIEKDVEHFS